MGGIWRENEDDEEGMLSDDDNDTRGWKRVVEGVGLGVEERLEVGGGMRGWMDWVGRYLDGCGCKWGRVSG